MSIPARERRLAWWIVGGIVAIRLIFTGLMGLTPQDAYYDFYAQHLALSYYDHPPGIALLLRGFTQVLGKTEFAVKFADFVCTLATTLAFWRLARRFFDREGTQTALLLFLSTLMVTILSLISTPDVPMLLFWTLSLTALYDAVFRGRRLSWVWAGLLAGACFDSKYTAVLLPGGLFLFLVFSNPCRRWLWTIWPAIFLVLFCAMASPVYIWNKQNHFASFRFQSAGRVNEMGGLHFDITGFFGVIGHQAALLIPVLFFALLWFGWRGLRHYRWRHVLAVPDEPKFLLAFFLPAFLGFFALSFFYWVKLNWMMPAYITGILWVTRYISAKWLRAQAIVSAIVHVALAIEVLFYPVPIQSDDTWFGWREMAAGVKQIRASHPDAFLFSADDYKTAAMLNFYLPEFVYSKNVVGERALQFDFVGTDLGKLTGKDAIYIDSNPRFDSLAGDAAPPAFYGRYFHSFEPLPPILVYNHGRPVRKFSVFLCHGYRPPKP